MILSTQRSVTEVVRVSSDGLGAALLDETTMALSIHYAERQLAIQGVREADSLEDGIRQLGEAAAIRGHNLNLIAWELGCEPEVETMLAEIRALRSGSVRRSA